MIQKTRGIALKVTNYSESSIVVHIFTEHLGMQSYLVNGARKPKAKLHSNLFQPLHLLEMVVYNKNTNNLQRIKEAQAIPSLTEIPFDILKGSVAMFLNEVVYKVLMHQSSDPYLFNFIHTSIHWLDKTDQPIQNFHLSFLMQLSKYLGYLPTITQERKPFFDLMDGIFTDIAPAHSYVLQDPHTQIFYDILTTPYELAHTLKVRREDRMYLLNQIINFYKLHTENFGSVHSLLILEELFN